LQRVAARWWTDCSLHAAQKGGVEFACRAEVSMRHISFRKKGSVGIA